MGKKSTIKRKLTAWTAIVAVLMMMLAPEISRALSSNWPQNRQAAADAFRMEICSVFGNKNPSSSDSSPSFPSQHGVPAHCPYCLMHADIVAPPGAVAVDAGFFSVSYFLPRLFYRSPQPLFAWTVASSRAPPSVS